jgi:hypothetical protein
VFSRISRYRNLPEVTVPDARGRVVLSKSLRLLPAAGGTFVHTIDAFDRLDHLAYKYYRQSRDWWRIADANPGFLSPHALLGHEPRRVLRLTVAWSGPWAPWAPLLRALRGASGVDAALLGTEDEPEPTVEIVPGTAEEELAPALTAELDASVLARAATPALADALADAGVVLEEEVEPVKVDAVTWRITGARERRVHTFEHDPASPRLRVVEDSLRHRWTIVVTCDPGVLPPTALTTLVEGRGFTVPGPPSEIGRIGKPLIIPPRSA